MGATCFLFNFRKPLPNLSKRVLRCRRLRGSVFSRLFCCLLFCLSLPYWGIPHTTPECHLSISYQVFLDFFSLLPVPQTWLWLVGCFVSGVQTIVASSVWWWEQCLSHWFLSASLQWIVCHAVLHRTSSAWYDCWTLWFSWSSVWSMSLFQWRRKRLVGCRFHMCDAYIIIIYY